MPRNEHQRGQVADTFFINSDAISNNGVSYHDAWLSRQVAVTSGGSGYLRDISRPARGNLLLLWVNGIGIVAAGTVLDDEPSIVRGGDTISPLEPEEYHRQMNWYADLRSAPITSAQVVAFRNNNPLQAFSALNKGKEAILALIATRAEQLDLSKIMARGDVTSTQVEILCQARRGQGKYREQLLTLWEGKCAVTGVDFEPVLKASHALAWKDATDAQRLDPRNGLPLIATLDALFDRGLISFDANGTMLCAPSLLDRHRQAFDLPSDLTRPLDSAQQGYLQMHRQRFGFDAA